MELDVVQRGLVDVSFPVIAAPVNGSPVVIGGWVEPVIAAPVGDLPGVVGGGSDKIPSRAAMTSSETGRC